MSSNDAATEKRIVDQLSFGRKTAKRVTWEAWEFEIIGPQQIEVTNASYGFEKADHRYVVTVEDQGGLFVPDKCECPADQYNEEYSCKHRVAVATIGGPVVLGAAMAYTSDESGKRLRADGGVIEADTHTEGRPDDCDCAPFMADHGLPCWPCYRDGFETPNPEPPEGSE
jgi:hypothetical protein